MNSYKVNKFQEIQEVVDKLNTLLDKELENLENGQCESDKKVQEIASLIDDGISKQLKILGYIKK